MSSGCLGCQSCLSVGQSVCGPCDCLGGFVGGSCGLASLWVVRLVTPGGSLGLVRLVTRCGTFGWFALGGLLGGLLSDGLLRVVCFVLRRLALCGGLALAGRRGARRRPVRVTNARVAAATPSR